MTPSSPPATSARPAPSRRRRRAAAAQTRRAADHDVRILKMLLEICSAAILACVAALALLFTLESSLKMYTYQHGGARAKVSPTVLRPSHGVVAQPPGRRRGTGHPQTRRLPLDASQEPCRSLPLRRGYCLSHDASGRAVVRHMTGHRHGGAVLPVYDWMNRLPPHAQYRMHVRERAAMRLWARFRHNPAILHSRSAAEIARLIDNIVGEVRLEDGASEDGVYGSHRIDPDVLAAIVT